MLEIAGYKLGSLLGAGTFGETYKATKNGETVALKLIKEDAIQRDVDVKRFQREVRAIQKAVGLNVVRLLDSGIGKLGNEVRYYIALEYLEGQNLNDAFKNSQFQFSEGLLKTILQQIVNGLETVHNQNIIHRDLKPANIFLTKAGEIKLLDFGLVKMLDYTTLTTRPGQPIGTPNFIAPEILRGEAIDHRADFYSLGVLIYYLITEGELPFTATTPLELYARIVNMPPVPPTKHNRKISSDFENIVLKLLSKQAYERYTKHQELKEAFKNTSLEISDDHEITPRQVFLSYQKQWFFNLLLSEKSDVETFSKSGDETAAFIYPAHFLPTNKKVLEILRNNNFLYLIDPSTIRLTYSSYAQTQGIVNLPYLPDKNAVLNPSALSTISELQRYAQGALDWQLKWGSKYFVAPYHFCRDINSEWIDIDIKLIEESVAYSSNLPKPLPVYACLSLNIEHYTNEKNRIALLNRYSRARADGYIFHVDEFDEKNINSIQIKSYFELLRLFQRLGKPVIAGRVGTLGLGFLAAGVDGASSGIASLSSFSENKFLRNRTTNFNMPKNYYVPNLMLTLPVQMAQDILDDSRNSYLRCDCPFCRMSPRDIERVAKAHFLHTRTQEVKEIQNLSGTKERLIWFNRKVDKAIQFCDSVRKQQIVALKSEYYSHLRIWKQVFNP